MFARDAGIAQLVEQLICNQQVGGSSPSTSSNPRPPMPRPPQLSKPPQLSRLPMPRTPLMPKRPQMPGLPAVADRANTTEYGGIPEWPKGADCKSVVTDFGGSNPPSPTKQKTASGGFFAWYGYLEGGFEQGGGQRPQKHAGGMFLARGSRIHLPPPNSEHVNVRSFCISFLG